MTTASSSFSSLLLVPVVRTPLPAFLPLRELVTLLATCRTIREDNETLEHLLDRCALARRLVVDAISDWSAPEPEVRLYAPFWNRNDYAWDNRATKRARIDSHERVAFPRELQAPGRRASFVSLAVMLATQLETAINAHDTPSVTTYCITPVILPLTHRTTFMTSHPPTKGHTAALRCHLENISVNDQGRVECALCTATKSMVAELVAYREQRDRERDELTQRLQAEGYDYSSDEYHDQMDAFEERKAASGEYYDEGRLDESDEMRDMIVQSRARAGLPPLAFIGDAPYDALSEALGQGFYKDDAHNEASSYEDGPVDETLDPGLDDGEAHGSFCEKNLQPLVALLHNRNGFKSIRHRLLKSSYISDKWSDDDVHHIEMLGGVAPHGFFAGVYIMARYT